MAEHNTLTGASLHEPKGVETAAANEVYHADGVGSGDWVDPLTRIKNVNSFNLNDKIADISTANSNAFFYAPFNSVLNSIVAILGGAITVANSTLTIYKNGVSTTKTLVVPYSGSAAGVKSTASGLGVSISAGDVLEVRSDGNSTDTQIAYVTLTFTAT